MSAKEEVIKAAEILKAYCDNMQVFSHGCKYCPLEDVCNTIEQPTMDKMSELMKDVIHEVKYSYV